MPKDSRAFEEVDASDIRSKSPAWFLERHLYILRSYKVEFRYHGGDEFVL